MSEHDTSESQNEVAEVHVPTTGRRELFTKAGAAAAVVAVAGLASSKSVEAGNLDNMVLGTGNTATNTTQLSGGSSLYVANGTSFNGNTSSIRGTTDGDDRSGVRGEASGSAGRGVYGISSGSGGVGVYGLNEGAGTDGAGVVGRNTGGSHGVRGEATNAAGAGVYGVHATAGGRGVYGNYDGTAAAGTGVLGIAALGVGVDGRGTEYDFKAGASGRLGLDKVGHDGSPTDGAAIGTIARDSAGNLWYCYAANKWQRLAGPNASGAFHSIEPTRVFDSRIAATPGSGVFTADSSRVISIKDGRDLATGAVTVGNLVPSGATAIAFNVTATATTAPSFLAVGPGNAASFKASSLNWAGGGATIANGTSVKLDASRQVKVFAGPGGTFQAIIDVTGFYL